MKIKGLTVQKVLVVAGGRHRHRELRRPHPRPRDAAAGVHGEPGRRDRHRGGRGQDAGEDRHACRSIRTYGLLPHQALALGFVLYRDFNQVKAAAKIMEQLYTAFMSNGARWPRSIRWSRRRTGEVLALDAKIVIDDNELDLAPGPRRRCATTPPRSRARRRRGGRTSRSSSSTATSAAW